MEVGLCWHQKGTYDLMDHLIIDLQAIVALASMPCNQGTFELHMGDEKIFNYFINECLGFTLYK
jgi:hypothetical protein